MSENNSVELARVMAPQLRDLKDTGAILKSFSQAIEPGFFGFEKTSEVFSALMLGHDIGLTPGQSLNSFNVIFGKPTLTANAMMGICLSHPKVCEYFRLVETTDKKCTYETKRVTDPNPIEFTYSIADAKTAGYYDKKGSMWKRLPRNMCRARCISTLARETFPDLVGGFYTADEIKDEIEVSVVEPKKEKTPQNKALGRVFIELRDLGFETNDSDLFEFRANLSQDLFEVRSFTELNVAQLSLIESKLKQWKKSGEIEEIFQSYLSEADFEPVSKREELIASIYGMAGSGVDSIAAFNAWLLAQHDVRISDATDEQIVALGKEIKDNSETELLKDWIAHWSSKAEFGEEE